MGSAEEIEKAFADPGIMFAPAAFEGQPEAINPDYVDPKRGSAKQIEPILEGTPTTKEDMETKFKEWLEETGGKMLG